MTLEFIFKTLDEIVLRDRGYYKPFWCICIAHDFDDDFYGNLSSWAIEVTEEYMKEDSDWRKYENIKL
jgi:hypothetical protein